MRKILLAVSIGLFSSSFMVSTQVVADDVSDWRKQVSKAFIKSHIYPRAALSRELEGKARVQVTISRSGEITTYEVVEPTGQPSLDKVIPKMMGKLNPLPAPPASLADNDLVFVVPISWHVN